VVRADEHDQLPGDGGVPPAGFWRCNSDLSTPPEHNRVRE